MAKRSGGEIIAEGLGVHGTEAVFCVPGESYLPLLDALYARRETIRVVACRHEHGAAFMAEAYGKLTGRPGVCLVTRGPGACNAAIGVHTAFQDQTPMLLVVGQVRRAFRGREAFQEVDLARMFAPLAKRAVEIDDAAALPRAITEGCREAVSGRPGPVVLAVPEDVLAERAEAGDIRPVAAEQPEPDPGLIQRLHRILGDAERPLMILGGGGWSDAAREDIAAFAAANGLPTCCTFRRLDLLPSDHPGFIGELGIAPDPALIERVKAADVILAVGTRLGEIPSQGYTLFAPDGGARELIHVFPDPAEIGRVFPAALAIPCAPPPFAAAARALAPLGGERWREWAAAARAEHLASRIPPPVEGDLDLGRAMTELDRRLPADALITVDAGNFSGWPQRFLRFGGGRRLLGPVNGAMGYAVPAAVAAKITRAERTVLACVGDGGFGMTGQELATAMASGAAPVIMVFNNRMYGTIRMHQERRFPGRVIGTDLVNPDFAALARAYGAHGEAVRRSEEFAPALERALAAGTAAVIELVVDPEQITTRTTLTAVRQAAQRPDEQGGVDDCRRRRD